MTKTIADASTDEHHKLRISTDRHGCVIDVDGFKGSFILDLSAGELRFFWSNENGDVLSGPFASFNREGIVK